jgi:ubiquinone/menaquinone biosynthesis C-methylase UbiE
MNEAQIAHNVAVHNRIAATYAETHGEIFNAIEQARLRAALERAVGHVRSGGLQALDFGAGSGNLSEHLRALGADVTSSDVSEGFLERLAARGFRTARLNGVDLQQFPSGSFDLVAVYSVLHHVPDYLLAVKEMARVLRPGGVLFIDHESSPSVWQPTEELRAFWAAVNPPKPLAARLLNLLSPRWYALRARLLINPRYQPEGDIHVWPDDHVEWDRVEEASGCEVVERTEYLLCRRGCPPDLYERFSGVCADARMLIARKRS